VSININRVNLTGRLTADPDISFPPSGTAVATFRVAVNGSRKVDGKWQDKPMYFNVKTWGARAESVEKFLTKGQMVAVDGHLDWREWTDKSNNRHEAVEIVATTVQFLSEPSEKKKDPHAGPPTQPTGQIG
jgi:single-strand DNA-binding protein